MKSVSRSEYNWGGKRRCHMHWLGRPSLAPQLFSKRQVMLM